MIRFLFQILNQILLKNGIWYVNIFIQIQKKKLIGIPEKEFDSLIDKIKKVDLMH